MQFINCFYKVSEQEDRGQPITKSRNSGGSKSETESNKNPTKILTAKIKKKNTSTREPEGSPM